jgi:hypothetical protein
MTVPPKALVEADPGPRAEGQPQEAGLVDGGLALDMRAVQAGVQAFLDRLDVLGSALSSAPGGASLYWWLLTVGAACAACEVARRQLKPSRRLGFGLGDSLLSWDPATDQTWEDQP